MLLLRSVLISPAFRYDRHTTKTSSQSEQPVSVGSYYTTIFGMTLVDKIYALSILNCKTCLRFCWGTVHSVYTGTLLHWKHCCTSFHGLTSTLSKLIDFAIDLASVIMDIQTMHIVMQLRQKKIEHLKTLELIIGYINALFVETQQCFFRSRSNR